MRVVEGIQRMSLHVTEETNDQQTTNQEKALLHGVPILEIGVGMLIVGGGGALVGHSIRGSFGAKIGGTIGLIAGGIIGNITAKFFASINASIEEIGKKGPYF